MEEKVKIVTVFGSSKPIEGDEEYRLAYEVGKHLVANGFTVCNGGYSGIMEASARGAKEAGGKTIGVTFNNHFGKTSNSWIDEEILKPTLIERMLKLVELGDAYVVLKGGTGTLLELAAVWEFINKKFIKERPVILIGNFWNDVVETMREELIREGMSDCTKYIRQCSSPEECAEIIKERFNILFV
ncbi:MAG: LOG family protein [Bacteroidetes bacterium]|nr:LOG family protein [Bacteroidota bacterium]